MGSWAPGSFGNDDALDFAADLIDYALGWEIIPEALQAVVSEKKYLDEADGCRAIAAAEVVAAMQGHPGPDLPEAVQTWLAQHPQRCPAAWVVLAQEAVARIGRRSGLQDLWEEHGEVASWRTGVQDLARRLSLLPRTPEAHR